MNPTPEQSNAIMAAGDALIQKPIVIIGHDGSARMQYQHPHVGAIFEAMDAERIKQDVLYPAERLAARLEHELKVRGLASLDDLLSRFDLHCVLTAPGAPEAVPQPMPGADA